MSTPTDQFANLSIGSRETPMPPTEEQVRYRAAELQDILSSFDVDKLPVEFQELTFENITGRRPSPLRLRQSEWTISGNLPGTLLQWGAYNEQGWRFLSQIQSPASRALAFSEKLNRRFDECFDEYDALQTVSSAATIKENIYRIARNLFFLSTVVYEDRQRRQLGEFDTLTFALRALASLCERTSAIIPAGSTEPTRRSSRRTASLGEGSVSLFTVVIRQYNGSSDRGPFLLEALELFSSAALKTCLQQLVSINGLLNRNSAGEEYIQRFEALQQKANEDIESASEAAEVPGGSSGGGRGGSGGRRHGLEADPRPGSKRPPHPTADTTQKRGKTSGTK